MDQPNIILIVLDTLRKDVLPMYGGNAYTPNLDEFIKDSVVFPKPVAPYNSTVPSHFSFFTGMYAIEHGVHEYLSLNKYIGPEFMIFQKLSDFKNKKLIQEILLNKGYNTIEFSANSLVGSSTKFSKGFNYSEDIDMYYLDNIKDIKKIISYEKNKIKLSKLNLKNFIKLYKIYRKANFIRSYVNFPLIKGADIITNKIVNSSFNSPFYLFINFMEMHEPYIKWEPMGKIRLKNYYYRVPNYSKLVYNHYDILENVIPNRIMNRIRNTYKNNVSNIDYYLGKLIKYLKEIKVFDNTLIIITSDHGQALKEKNYYGHGLFLYNEIIEVPLIVKFPNSFKFKPKDGYQSLVDLPTLILNSIEGNYIDITRETVFSESYGLDYNIDGSFKNKDKEELFKNKIAIPRKAIYKNDYKLVVNMLGNIEEFLYKGKEIKPEDNKEVLEDLFNELEIFKGTEKFVVRK